MELTKPISNYIRIKRLQRAKKKFEIANRLMLDEIQYFDMHNEDSTPPEIEMVFRRYWRDIRIIETEKLRRLAEKWNIELKKDWIGMMYSEKGEQLHLLSDEAITIIRNLIKTKRRENVEWWITKVIVPLAGLLITLLSLMVAILALRNK